MSSSHSISPSKLDYYSFVWSEIRLLIAAIALFAGGVPTVYLILPFSTAFGIVGPLLKVAWIVSGGASGYLVYRWYTNRQMIFGKKDQKDMLAFWVSVVSGLNLGIAGLTGRNIGMSITSGSLVLVLVGVLYLFAAWHLFMRWKALGKKIF